MRRLRCLSLCACLALSLTAMACGSSNSGAAAGGASGSSGGGGTGASASGWDQGRICDTGTEWWMTVRKGAYYFYAKASPSFQDAATGRAMVIDFVKMLVAKPTAGAPAPVTLVPTLSEMPAVPGGSGWTLDPNESKTMAGPAVATNKQAAVDLVDGGADPFYVVGSYSAVELAWERWVNDPWLMELKLWQMASAADATQLYTDLLTNSTYAQIVHADGSSAWINCPGTDPANPCP